VSATSNRLSLADLSFDPAGDACQEAKAKYRLGRGYNPGDVKACVAKPPKSQLSRLSQSDVASFTTAQPPKDPALISPMGGVFSARITRRGAAAKSADTSDPPAGTRTGGLPGVRKRPLGARHRCAPSTKGVAELAARNAP
jgi:hypothetical protein